MFSFLCFVDICLSLCPFSVLPLYCLSDLLLLIIILMSSNLSNGHCHIQMYTVLLNPDYLNMFVSTVQRG